RSPPDPHPFPTRRSSDLKVVNVHAFRRADIETRERAQRLTHEMRVYPARRQDHGNRGAIRPLVFISQDDMRAARPDPFLSFAAKDRKSTRLNSSHVAISY